SSFLNGFGRGIVVDSPGNAYVAAMTPLLAGRDSEVLVTKVNAPSADVSVTNFASPDPVPSLANLTYSITITNTGPDSATAVTPSDPPPAGTALQDLCPNPRLRPPARRRQGTGRLRHGAARQGAQRRFPPGGKGDGGRRGGHKSGDSPRRPRRPDVDQQLV